MVLASKHGVNADYAFFGRWKVCIENGSSLCVGCQLCWSKELQVLPTFFGMPNHSICFLLISSSFFPIPWFS